MVLSSLHTDQGQPTGLSLACSSSAIVDAVQQLKPIFSTRSIIDNSTLEGNMTLHVNADWHNSRKLAS